MADATRTIRIRPTLKDLAGKKLEGFTVEQYTEVYKTDVEGRGKEKSLGYFRDEDIAKAIAGKQTDAAWHKTEKAFLLTNGKIAFLLGEAVKLVDNEASALEARQAALAKLTPEERKLLDL